MHHSRQAEEPGKPSLFCCGPIPGPQGHRGGSFQISTFSNLDVYEIHFSTFQMWKAALSSLSHSSNSSCGLWLNSASVGGLASEATRHNTPSRAHALIKLVQNEKKAGTQVAIIVS